MGLLLYLFQNLYIHHVHCLLLLFEYFLVSDGIVIIAKVIEGWVILRAPEERCCQSSFLMDLGKIIQLTHMKLWCIIKNVTSSMTECTVIFRPSYVCDDINIFCFSDFVYAPVFLQLTLTSLQNILKIDF